MTPYIQQKLDDYASALATLHEVVLLTNPSQLEKDGALQRFEYCFELAWKCLKLVLEDRGITPVNSPKTAFSQGFIAQLLTDEPLWLSILAYRNKSVHTYDSDLAEEVFEKIPAFYAAMNELLLRLRQA